MSLLETHLFAVAFWFGLLAMETVLELQATTAQARELAARIHAWNDTLFELPAITVILVSGVLLLLRTWPPGALLVVKISLGGGAILTNYVCYSFVRRRVRADDAERIALTRKVKLTGWAIPPAMIAFVIGMFWL